MLELAKARISAAVMLSVATGYLLYAERVALEVLLPAAGVFLLACGSAALNQVQEARLDARMARTKGRPIPSGRIGRDWALFVAVVLLAAAFSTLASVEAHTGVILALAGLAVLWYNGVYTLLKRATAFAVVPGALVGAIPPAVGWAAAGGVIYDPLILEVAFFFYIWQIPHFWLLLLMNSEDFAAAGLPVPTRLLAPAQVGRITFMWILAVGALGILLAWTGRMGLFWKLGLLAASLWLAFGAFRMLGRESDRAALRPAFMRINAYAFLVMVCLAGNALA